MQGALAFRAEAARAQDRLGNHGEADKILRANDGAIIVSATSEKRIAGRAQMEAESWAVEVEAKCRLVLIDHNAAGEYVPSRVRALLMQAVRSYIGPAPGLETFARRGRPAKVRNIEAHRAWEQSHLKYLRGLRVDLAHQNMLGLADISKDQTLDAAVRREARTRLRAWKRYSDGQGPQPEQLTNPKLKGLLETARTRERNTEIVTRAIESEEVAYLLWTNYPELAMSGSSCDYCESLNGLVVPKGSDFVGVNSPPVHSHCHCRWKPIERAWAKRYGVKATPKRKYPEGEPAEGYGGLVPRGVAAKKGK